MAKTPRSGASTPSLPMQSAVRVDLAELHFDPANPRFAKRGMKGASEIEILDEIVETYGVEDVISSIAVNGYLETEPLVGIRKNSSGGAISIVEGNRRLAALLILTNDPRSVNQDRLRASHSVQFPSSLNPVPVVAYAHDAQPKQLWPYLGVRHIVGARAWDSYAKAAWVAQVLEDHPEFTIEQIEAMIGDSRGTVKRILEGYYLVDQLIDSDRFRPADSMKKGKGSLGEFPFSWVYNALGYRNVKLFLGIADDAGPKPKPLKRSKLDDAADLMGFMFGNKSKKIEPAIRESREISDLALCLAEDSMVAQLRTGTLVSDALWQSKTGKDRVLQSLAKADTHLGEALKAAPEIERSDASRILPSAEKVRALARDLFKALSERATAIDDDD